MKHYNYTSCDEMRIGDIFYEAPYMHVYKVIRREGLYVVGAKVGIMVRGLVNYDMELGSETKFYGAGSTYGPDLWKLDAQVEESD